MSANRVEANKKQQLGIAVTALAEAFRQKVTAATLLAYEIGLGDLSIEVVQESVRLAIRRCRFMPTVSELRELVGRSETDEARADLAWSCALRAVSRVGRYRSVSFIDDPITNAVIRSLGGWVAFCDRFSDERDADKWLRKDFCDTYRRFQSGRVPPEHCRALVGEHDAHNLLHAREYVKQPVAVVTGLPLLSRFEAQRLVASKMLAPPESVAELSAIGCALRGVQ